MVLSFIVPLAALEAGDVPLHGPDPGKSGAAFSAGVKESAFEADPFQRKVMAARFVRYSEIGAGLAPFEAVRSDLPAAGAMLRQKVSKFMAQRALHLRRRNLDELRIERNSLGPPTG